MAGSSGDEGFTPISPDEFGTPSFYPSRRKGRRSPLPDPIPMTDEESTALYSYFDLNGNGAITYGEFANVFYNRRALLKGEEGWTPTEQMRRAAEPESDDREWKTKMELEDSSRGAETSTQRRKERPKSAIFI